jgi:hypothetical protein
MNVMHCIAMKLLTMFRRSRAALGEAAAIAFSIVKVMIDVSVKVVCPVVPGSRSNEYAPCKPLRSIVTVRSAVVRRSLVVSIRTDRRYSNIDRDLGGCLICGGQKKASCKGRQAKYLYRFHSFTFRCANPDRMFMRTCIVHVSFQTSFRSFPTNQNC